MSHIILGAPDEGPVEDKNWKGNQSKKIHKIIFPPLETILYVKTTKDGIIVRGKSSGEENVVFIIGGKSAGKTDTANSIVHEAFAEWGEENVHVMVSKNFHAMVGNYDKESRRFFGSKFCSTKPVHIIIHDDAITQLSSNATDKTIDDWQKVFQNSRHLITYRDQYNNRRGYNLFITIFQDYYGLHPRIRTEFSIAMFKTMPKNYQHWAQFRKMIPKQGVSILEDNSNKIREKRKEQSFKSRHIVDMGYGEWGEWESVYVEHDYCSDESPYFIHDDGTTNAGYIESPEQHQTYEIIEEGEVVDRKLTKDDIDIISIKKEEEFPIYLVKEAFEWLKFNPPETASKYLKNEKKIWKAGYMYFCQSVAPNYIIEDDEINLKHKQSLTNGYGDGGYFAVLEQEVLGHIMERVIPKYITDIKWTLITGQSLSDFKDYDAMNSEVKGVGLHGELKTRRGYESPMVDPELLHTKQMKKNWVSVEGMEHILAGGTVVLYQLVLRRMNTRSKAFLWTYHVKLKDIKIKKPQVIQSVPAEMSVADAHDVAIISTRNAKISYNQLMDELGAELEDI